LNGGLGADLKLNVTEIRGANYDFVRKYVDEKENELRQKLRRPLTQLELHRIRTEAYDLVPVLIENGGQAYLGNRLNAESQTTFQGLKDSCHEVLSQILMRQPGFKEKSPEGMRIWEMATTQLDQLLVGYLRRELKKKVVIKGKGTEKSPYTLQEILAVKAISATYRQICEKIR
jgi:hypothetical protein